MKKFLGIPLNANAVHNYINGIVTLTGIIITMNLDWTVFGFNSIQALKIAGYIMLANGIGKFLLNVGRDGVGGLVAVQPPVERAPESAVRPDPGDYEPDDYDGLK